MKLALIALFSGLFLLTPGAEAKTRVSYSRDKSVCYIRWFADCSLCGSEYAGGRDRVTMNALQGMKLCWKKGTVGNPR